MAHLPPSALAAIEADTFWCLSKLLDGIQDNYISQQPGIQRLVKRMGELVKRIDGECHNLIFKALIDIWFLLLRTAPLAAHFEDQGVEFMQFAFRWMNCLLMREISVRCTIRMWDTYLVRRRQSGLIVGLRLIGGSDSGGRNRCVLPVPSVRVLGVARQVLGTTTGDGFPGEYPAYGE